MEPWSGKGLNEEIHSINKVNSSPRIGTTINSTARKSSEEERVFYRVDLSPDAVHAIRLDSKATTPIPFSPPPCNYHRLLQFATANTPCTMHVPFSTFSTLPRDTSLLASSVLAAQTFCQFARSCKSIRGIRSFETVRGWTKRMLGIESSILSNNKYNLDDSYWFSIFFSVFFKNSKECERNLIKKKIWQNKSIIINYY